MDRMGEQQQQVSNTMSELERAVLLERENLWNKSFESSRRPIRRKNACKKERMTTWLSNCHVKQRKAKQSEQRLRDYLKLLRSQQEQTLGTLESWLDAMMEIRTANKMDRLDHVMNCHEKRPRSSRTNSRDACKELKVSFSEPSVEARRVCLLHKGIV